jgi:7-keto-8-aminopelargonate synthetase-like enzyme
LLGLAGDIRVREAASAALKRLGLQPTAGLRLQTELEQRMAAFWGAEDAFYSALPSPVFNPLLELAKHTWTAEAEAWPFLSFPQNQQGSFLEFLGAPSPPSPPPSLVLVCGISPFQGCLPPLSRLLQKLHPLKGSLCVDESLSLGILGEGGKGTDEHFHLPAQQTWKLCDLGHTLGAQGFVFAGPRPIVNYLRGHPLGRQHSLGQAPSLSAALRALQLMEAEPWRRERLWEVARQMHQALRKLGFDLGPSTTPLIPLWVGEEMRLEALREALQKAGLWLRERLQGRHSHFILCPKATHSDEEIKRSVELLAHIAHRNAWHLNESAEQNFHLANSHPSVLANPTLPRWTPCASLPPAYASAGKAQLYQRAGTSEFAEELIWQLINLNKPSLRQKAADWILKRLYR